MKNIPLEERPREKLRKRASLSHAELVAIIMGSGMQGKPVLALARELVDRFKTLSALTDATIEELMEVKGIGEAKAIQLKAAFALGRKLLEEAKPKRLTGRTPEEVYEAVSHLYLGESREVLRVLLLDAKGVIQNIEIISIGILTETLVHPREVFYPAIRHKAASIILVHNHPSGDATPSLADRQVTIEIEKGGKLLGIPLIDHLIIGENCIYSIKKSLNLIVK